MTEVPREDGVPTGFGEESLVIGVHDSRRVMAYLLAKESDDYVAVMGVLESSVTDMTPAEVASALRVGGTPLDLRVVETRLEKLREWGAATARTDSSHAQRYADLLARNWRYTATTPGRQVHRFYTGVLAGVPAMREIPLGSLARVVDALEALAGLYAGSDPAQVHDITQDLGQDVAEHVGRLFTSHDDLDGALVGAEDALAGLVDRFDLDDDRTRELKRLLVDYATHVAAELDRGAARAVHALTVLEAFVPALARAAVAASDAQALIERGALTASRGGREQDWAGLMQWFDPGTGRAARFALRLVRALPGMHANLRRLHTSAGTATTRSRALMFARASLDPDQGPRIWLAALGDHSWRKLAGVADDEDDARGSTPWRDGPAVDVPELLRSNGRTGTRGRAANVRDDTAAKAHVAALRAARQAAHADALREVLAADAGAPLSAQAAKVALAALGAAARTVRPVRLRGLQFTARHAVRDGLACTLLYVPDGRGGAQWTGVLRAPSWRVLLPGRVPVFHAPGTAPVIPAGLRPNNDTGDRVQLRLVEGAA